MMLKSRISNIDSERSDSLWALSFFTATNIIAFFSTSL